MDFHIFKASAKKNLPITTITPFARLLKELETSVSDPEIAEIYLSTATGFTGLDRKGKQRAVPLNWTSTDITEFLLELAWESKTRIDPFKPFAGGVIPTLPWRWHAIIAPMSPEGPLLVLRRQLFDEIGLDEYIFKNFFPGDIVKWLNAGTSIVFYGATGSGKTTLLVAVMREFFSQTRVGIVEGLSEIPLTSNHWFRLLEVSPDAGGRGGIDFKRVVAEMMRLSPKLLVMGELRGNEAAMLSDFARTGHGGVMTTLHAGSIEDARIRLAQLANTPLTSMPSIIGIKVWRDSLGVGQACMDHLH